MHINRKIIVIIIVLTILQLSKVNVHAVSFIWPSTGYIGYRYNGNSHNGVDVWSQSDGGWNGDVEGVSNAVYSAYLGDVVYKDSSGYIIKHNDTLYSNYWHIRNKQVSVGDTVNTNTIIGYQDIANNVVHLHLTVSATSSGSGHVDPSPYFGMQLNMSEPDPIASGTYVERPNACGLNNVVLQGQNYGSGSSLDCSATNSVRILPDFTAANGSNIHLYIQH